jgi:hypothetical protein
MGNSLALESMIHRLGSVVNVQCPRSVFVSGVLTARYFNPGDHNFHNANEI